MRPSYLPNISLKTDAVGFINYDSGGAPSFLIIIEDQSSQKPYASSFWGIPRHGVSSTDKNRNAVQSPLYHRIMQFVDQQAAYLEPSQVHLNLEWVEGSWCKSIKL